MAVTLIAAVSSAVSYAITTTAFSWATAFAIAAAGAGLSLVSRALMPKPDLGAQMAGQSVMTREAAHSRKIIYGRARIGGNVVYLESTGDDNKYLWLVIAVAGHEIDAYEQVWFNDKKIWDGGSYVGNWGSYVSISFKDGSQATADSGLVAASSKWTSDHKLLDTAYMVVKLTYDQEQFAQGLPNISTVVRGKKVWHPSHSSPVWSQNPALCVRDYLTDTKYGLGESSSNIASINTALGVCDEAVDLAAGGTQPRYTMDGVIDTGNSIKANIENMVGSMIGRLVYSGGKFEIHAGEYVAPTVTIDESMMIGEISVQTKQSRRSAYNGVKGVFLSEEDNYILADYPAQISSTYATQDGDPIYLDMPLPYTVNNVRAQRIAQLALRRSRQQESITIPCNLNALKFKVGDNISVTNTRLGYSAKVFEVVGYSMGFSSDQMVVNVDAIETASSIWSWDEDEEVFLGAGEVALYDGTSTAAPTNLTVTADSYLADDGTFNPYFNVTWNYSDDAFVDHYIVEWRTGSNDYYSQATKTKPFEIRSLQQGASYDVRVKAVNEINVHSAYLTGSQTPATDTTAPSAPSSVSASGEFEQITINWTNPTVDDFSHIDVYRSTSSSGTYALIGKSAGTNFTDTNLAVSVTRYYKLKAIDYTGNASGYSSIVNATTTQVPSGGIADNAVDTDQIADDAVTNPTIATDAVNQDSIAANSVTATEIVAGTITATEIAADAVTADKINVSNLAAINANMGTITAGSISSALITGDVTEVYPVGQYYYTALTSSAATLGSFTLPAPTNGILKRQKIDINVLFDIQNNSQTPMAQATIVFTVQKKSKGVNAVSVGTVTVESESLAYNQLLSISGNVLDKVDISGGVAASVDASGTNEPAYIQAVYYDSGSNKTFIQCSAFTDLFSTGNTMYFSDSKFTSAGTWVTPSTTETIFIPTPPDPSSGVGRASLWLPFKMSYGQTTTLTDYRVRAHVSNAQSSVDYTAQRMVGTLENIS